LIVEDDETRCGWFHQQFAQIEIDATDNVSIALRWLSERRYSLIFLDHDLVEEHYFSDVSDDGLSGYAVAAWLAENPERQPKARIIIHSLNYAGAQRMLNVLQRAGRNPEHIPFPDLPRARSL
jgi:CheY-like chemotaxis protein